MNHINATQTLETPAKTAIYENEQFHQFASFNNQKHVIITNGEKGFATLSSEAKEVKFHEVISVDSKQIIDTNGAGMRQADRQTHEWRRYETDRQTDRQ